VNVEPHPDAFARLAAARTRDVNLNVAVSEVPGRMIFYEFPQTAGQDTLDADVAERMRGTGWMVREREVACRTLAQVCEEHAGGRVIDFLKIDAEGHERSVLLGMDFTRWRPRVLVIEATEPCTPIPCHDRWEDLVLPRGYQFAFFDGLNRYYVRDEDSQLIPVLAVPANVFDDFVLYEHVAEVEAGEQRMLAKCREFDELHYEYSRLQAEHQRLESEHRRAVAELADLESCAAALKGEQAELRRRVAVLEDALARLRASTVPRLALRAALAVLRETRVHLDEARAGWLAGPR
jgi:FkbM family methyltransferase